MLYALFALALFVAGFVVLIRELFRDGHELRAVFIAMSLWVTALIVILAAVVLNNPNTLLY